MFGPAAGTIQVIGGASGSVDASGQVVFQFNAGHTIHSYSFADLWWEFPTTFVFRGTAHVGGDVATYSYSSSMGTPGVRLQVPIGSRVTLYGAVGVGYGFFQTDSTSVSPAISAQSRTNYHGVFDFGGGMDFRLTRRLSLRGEVRDFVTGQGLGGVSGRNHVVAGFGVALHF
jgi:opacity protein-like surface antigen